MNLEKREIGWMAIFGTMCCIACAESAYAGNGYYPIKTELGIVSETDTTNDIMTIDTSDGNMFQWDGVEDWTEGDLIEITFDTKGTVDRTDDEIISMTYKGNLKNL